MKLNIEVTRNKQPGKIMVSKKIGNTKFTLWHPEEGGFYGDKAKAILCWIEEKVLEGKQLKKAPNDSIGELELDDEIYKYLGGKNILKRDECVEELLEQWQLIAMTKIVVEKAEGVMKTRDLFSLSGSTQTSQQKIAGTWLIRAKMVIQPEFAKYLEEGQFPFRELIP